MKSDNKRLFLVLDEKEIYDIDKFTCESEKNNIIINKDKK